MGFAVETMRGRHSFALWYEHTNELPTPSLKKISTSCAEANRAQYGATGFVNGLTNKIRQHYLAFYI